MAWTMLKGMIVKQVVGKMGRREENEKRSEAFKTKGSAGFGGQGTGEGQAGVQCGMIVAGEVIGGGEKMRLCSLGTERSVTRPRH